MFFKVINAVQCGKGDFFSINGDEPMDIQLEGEKKRNLDPYSHTIPKINSRLKCER